MVKRIDAGWKVLAAVPFVEEAAPPDAPSDNKCRAMMSLFGNPKQELRTQVYLWYGETRDISCQDLFDLISRVWPAERAGPLGTFQDFMDCINECIRTGLSRGFFA